MDSKILDPKTRAGVAPYSDMIHVSRIREYIREHIGVEVSQRRVTTWIKCGDLHLIEVPKYASNRKWWTRASYIDKAIQTHILGVTTSG